MERVFVGLGGLAGLTGMAMSVYAAHVMTGAAQASTTTAVEMQMFHALALLFVAMWARRGGWLIQLAGVAFAVGIVLFCGSIYVTYLRGVRMTEYAPAGGMFLMGGWLLLMLCAFRR